MSDILETRGTDWLRLLPKYWFQNEPTSRRWDALLNLALDEHGVTEIGSHKCRVGPFTVWIGNYPYGFGDLYENGQKSCPLPMASTRRRLKTEIFEGHLKACLSREAQS